MTVIFTTVLLLTQIVGGQFVYTVEPGDTLTGIGARFGVEVRVLAESNNLRTRDSLTPGQTLNIDNRHIVPPVQDIDLIINVPQRMLFSFQANGPACAFPVAAGKSDWRTPLGEFEIVVMEEQPTWDVPVSIQEEMRRSGKPVVTRVPPSPDNPLGEYWIGLNLPGIGIHGTNSPSSIYKLTTHGCIRLSPENIRSLFQRVRIGMRGRIIYEPILITRSGESVFVEAHPDVYNKEAEPLRKVLDTARSQGFLDKLDLQLAQDVIRKREGIARDVTRR